MEDYQEGSCSCKLKVGDKEEILLQASFQVDNLQSILEYLSRAKQATNDRFTELIQEEKQQKLKKQNDQIDDFVEEQRKKAKLNKVDLDEDQKQQADELEKKLIIQQEGSFQNIEFNQFPDQQPIMENQENYFIDFQENQILNKDEDDFDIYD